MIKLKKPLNHKGLLHEAGSVVTVPPEFADKLVKNGMAESYVPEVKEQLVSSEIKTDTNQLNGLAALGEILKTTSKAVLLQYAEHAGVKDLNDKMKNEDIITAIMDDAKENGIDLEGIADEDLIQFAGLCGIGAVTEGMSRDELLNVTKKHFEEKADA